MHAQQYGSKYFIVYVWLFQMWTSATGMPPAIRRAPIFPALLSVRACRATNSMTMALHAVVRKRYPREIGVLSHFAFPSFSCVDVNECLEGAMYLLDLCTNDTGCVNLRGSYACACVPGYSLVNGSCQCKYRVIGVLTGRVTTFCVDPCMPDVHSGDGVA